MDIEHEVNELIQRVAALEAVVSEVAARTAAPAALAASAPVTASAPITAPAPTADPNQTFPPPAPGSTPNFPPPTPGAAPSYPPPVPGLYAQPTPVLRKPPAFEWGIETLLRWAGVVLVALAAIFLVSTAITRGWIGPELQLLGAAVGGCIMLWAADRLADSRRPWALALGCGGAAVVAISAIATHEWLDVVGPRPALIILVAATAVSIAVALKLRLEGIALVAGVIAMLGPIETLDDFGNGATLSWISACIIGSSALGLARTWPGVRLLIGSLGALTLMVFALSEDVEGTLQAMGFVGAAVVGLTMWAGPTIANHLPPSGSGMWGSFDWTPIDYRLVALVPAWVWAIVSGLLSLEEDRNYGIAAIVIAAGFLLLAETTFARVDRVVSIATFFGAFSLLAVGFAVYFDGPALMVALAGQAVTSYYLSRRLNDNLLRITAFITGLLASVFALFEMLDALDSDGFPTIGAAFATGLLVLGWAAATVLVHDRSELNIPFEVPFVVAWVGTMLWLAAALLVVPQGLVLISAAWAAMASAGLVLGLTRRMNIVKNVALGTLVVTLGKLVTIDMAEVDVFWRVGLFFVVGMGLITLGLKIPSLVRPVTEGHGDATPATNPGEDEPTSATFTTF